MLPIWGITALHNLCWISERIGTDEVAVRLHVEPLEEGGFLATSPDVPGLAAQGRRIVEAVNIAQGLTRKIVGSYLEHGDALPSTLSQLTRKSTLDFVIPVGVR
jgi:antitoxin HicB